jgi:hypothetical protein
MNTLGLTGTTEPTKAGFWLRMLTGKKPVFDLIFGVVGPILCFVFDPIIFRAGAFPGPPLIPELQVWVYLISGAEILTLLLWLGLRDSLPAKRFLGGALCAGGILCLLIGIGLLPFSVMGLVFGIGIFGFTPFFTALVYLRNGYQAIRSEQSEFVELGRTLPILLGCLLAFAVPTVVNVAVDQVVTISVNAIIRGNAEGAAYAAEALYLLEPLSGTKLMQIVDAYVAERDVARKEQLQKAYSEITGQDIKRVAASRERRFAD